MTINDLDRTEPMTAHDTAPEPIDMLLARAAVAGLRVRLTSADRVQVSGPPQLELRRELRARQSEAIAHLRRQADAALERLAGWQPAPSVRPPNVPWKGQRGAEAPQRRLPFRHGHGGGRGR
jgi:hypothetical protein